MNDTLARIDDQAITGTTFIKFLKLEGKYGSLMEEMLVERLTALSARRCGIQVAPEEVQGRVDEFRRSQGLHRAKDTFNYLDQLGVSLDEFETYMTDLLYREKMLAQIQQEEAIESCFRLHSPLFDAVEISQIVVESEGVAREIVSILEEEPDSFALLAEEHSLDSDTREQGGRIGTVWRGSLPESLEAKIFGATPGEVLGPFPSANGLFFEVYRIDSRHPARLDETTRSKIKQMLYRDWLQGQMQEHRLEVL